MTARQFYQQHAALPYSRIPILNETDISFNGYVHKDQILVHVVNHRDELTLAEICRELHSVPYAIALPDLLEYFVQHRESIALVEGEDGTIQGIVTIKDII
jgi:CBS domain containing-hemolysin-like protein